MPPSAGLYPQDCHEIYQLGIKENGIYTIQPDPKRPALEVQTLNAQKVYSVLLFKNLNQTNIPVDKIVDHHPRECIN